MTVPETQPSENPIQSHSSLNPSELPEQLRAFTTPLSRRGWPKWLVFAMAIIGLIYVLNPTLGILELIPDNLPLIGNLDEGVAYIMIWFGIVELFIAKNSKNNTGS
jgi:hypothetical protein